MSVDVVRVEFQDDLAFITINNPPVNATSQAVREGLKKAIEMLAQSEAKATIIRCDGKTFVAGGDITEFDKPPIEPYLPDVLDQLEACKILTIALMHGTVLGGGFEIALACDFRICLAGTKFGLPEVNIGLIPGAGGTQRLPRLVGVEAAVNIACSGRMVSAEEMFNAGAIDQVVDNLETGLVGFTMTLPPKPLAISKRNIKAPGADWFKEQRAFLTKKSKGQQSPLHALEAIEWATHTDYPKGLKRERERFSELKLSSESRALRHAFFAERKAAKPDTISGGDVLPLTQIAVIGGGLMGASICATALGAGYQVQMIERDDDAATSGAQRLRDILEGSVKRGKFSGTELAIQLANFSVSADYKDCANADMAIEAVFEDLTVKNKVFRSLADVMGRNAIFATNTSYLDPQKIFADINNPDRCLGLHFFSPAHIMKLLEIVKTPETSADVLATSFAFAKRIGKIPVLSQISDGFIGNRMLAAYRRQADYMLADGALPFEVDAAMRDFGMPMGPYELQDLTGLQIAWATRKRQAETRPVHERYVTLGDTLCDMERFGQRSAKGWYRYDDGNRSPVRDPQIEHLIADYRLENDIPPRSFTPEDIQGRLIAALANEGALIVEEGIAQSMSDVDVVKLHGYGFPRWRGGPMHYVKEVGSNIFAKHMSDVAEQSPNSWKISKWLTL
ncbi:MAG: 3-hydroxyacyl-CoA dehydrogenase NAD-binding domain-containing protein [Salaquimonas sp.]